MSASEVIIAEIARRGPIPFSRFVELALYHPTEGYYMNRPPIQGKGGDFYTSPQVSSLFGQVLAEAFISMRKTLESPRFSLIELGAGEGKLIVDVIDALAKKGMAQGLSVTVVEKDPVRLATALRRLSRFPKVKGVRDLSELDEDQVFDGCVYSNEFVDAFPFHRLVKEGGVWKEVAVSWTDGQFKEVLVSPTISVPEGLGEDVRQVLCRPAAGGWLEKASQLITRGYILTIDYGSGRAEYWDADRSGNQWACFKDHHLDKNPYVDVGKKDITADVDFTGVMEAGLACDLEAIYFNSQASFLLAAGKPIWEIPGEIPVDQRLTTQHLLHPSGMGEAFQVLLQAKNAPLPQFLTEASNRMRRLQWVAPSGKMTL